MEEGRLYVVVSMQKRYLTTFALRVRATDRGNKGMMATTAGGVSFSFNRGVSSFGSGYVRVVVKILQRADISNRHSRWFVFALSA